MESIDIVLRHIIESVEGNPVLSGLTILVVWALVQDFFLFRRLRRLVRGGDGKTLEGTIRTLQDRVTALESYAVKTSGTLSAIDARLKKSVRGVAMKQFDPFQGQGGQQSFSVALVDESGDGVVVSSIHARDGVRVYGKALTRFTSQRELSNEEKDAIVEAKKKLN